MYPVYDKYSPYNFQFAATWLMSEAKVSVPVRICQYWLSKDWSSSGKLLTIEAVEEACGERLRLPQYSGQFGDDDQAQCMTEILKESDPPLVVSNLLLRQWYLWPFKLS